MTCLIQISRYKFSLIIAGLTKALQRTNESVAYNELSNLQYLFNKTHLKYPFHLFNGLLSSGPLVQSNKLSPNDAITIRLLLYLQRWNGVLATKPKIHHASKRR